MLNDKKRTPCNASETPPTPRTRNSFQLPRADADARKAATSADTTLAKSHRIIQELFEDLYSSRQKLISYSSSSSSSDALMSLVRTQISGRLGRKGVGLPSLRLYPPYPPRSDLQFFSDGCGGQKSVFFVVCDGKDARKPVRKQGRIGRRATIRSQNALM